jgi:hypothetical protein
MTTASTPQRGLGRLERFAASWRLLRISFGILRKEPSLIGLTLLSILTRLLSLAAMIALVFFVVLPLLFPGLHTSTASTGDADGLFTAALIATPLVWWFIVGGVISSYFNGAIAHMTMERVEGRDPRIGAGLSAANRRFGPLAVFGIISGAVGLITLLISALTRGRGAGHLAGQAASALYGLFAGLALPVIMREPIGGGKAIARSTSIVRAVWPQATITGVGLRAVVQLAVAILGWTATLTLYLVVNTPNGEPAPGKLLSAAQYEQGALVLGGTYLIWIIINTLGNLLQAIFNGVLYLYATTGATGDFDSADLAAAAATADGVVRPGAARS